MRLLIRIDRGLLIDWTDSDFPYFVKIDHVDMCYLIVLTSLNLDIEDTEYFNETIIRTFYYKNQSSLTDRQENTLINYIVKKALLVRRFMGRQYSFNDSVNIVMEEQYVGIVVGQ